MSLFERAVTCVVGGAGADGIWITSSNVIIVTG